MPYQTGTATNYLDLLDQIRRYICGYGVAAAPVAGANTGNGTVSAVDTFPASVTETWTLTCTTAAANGGTFSVVGSVSGAQASATVGTPYSNAFIALTINDGSTDFIIGDSFTIGVTQGAMSAAGYAWQQMRWANGNELIVKGKGNSGTEEFYAGVLGYYSTPGDYYNFELRGFDGYVEGNSFSSQPNASAATYMLLWNSTIPYWLIADGDRLIVIAKITTIYEVIYVGKFLTYGLPSEYPVPVAVAGMMDASATRYSSTYASHTFMANPSSIYIRDPGGSWLLFSNGYGSSQWYVRTDRGIWPANSGEGSVAQLDKIRHAPDGEKVLYPLIIDQKLPSPNIFGEFKGCFWLSGEGVATESVVTVGADDYLVVQNAYRTGLADYMAIKLG